MTDTHNPDEVRSSTARPDGQGEHLLPDRAGDVRDQQPAQPPGPQRGAERRRRRGPARDRRSWDRCPPRRRPGSTRRGRSRRRDTSGSWRRVRRPLGSRARAGPAAGRSAGGGELRTGLVGQLGRRRPRQPPAGAPLQLGQLADRPAGRRRGARPRTARPGPARAACSTCSISRRSAGANRASRTAFGRVDRRGPGPLGPLDRSHEPLRVLRARVTVGVQRARLGEGVHEPGGGRLTGRRPAPAAATPPQVALELGVGLGGRPGTAARRPPSGPPTSPPGRAARRAGRTAAESGSAEPRRAG